MYKNHRNKHKKLKNKTFELFEIKTSVSRSCKWDMKTFFQVGLDNEVCEVFKTKKN